MRKITLTAAILAGTAMTSPALADGHLKIVEGDPLELTIQMNHARYPVYEEDWPVEQQAREWTNIHLKDVTVGANMRTDENTGKTEALNLMLAGGNIPTDRVVDGIDLSQSLFKQVVSVCIVENG